MSLPPLHERRTTTRFADRVEDYVRFRPSYPPEAIDAIVDGLGDPSSLIAADIGAGTGIMTRLLAERAMRTHAIEPNAEMRGAGESRLLSGWERLPAGCNETDKHRIPAGRGEVIWHDATAESTGLPDASVDLVVCAQAYHWFNPEAACKEFGRILKRPGRLALIWNDADESTPVARRYYELVREASTEGTTAHRDAAHAPTVAPPFGELREMHFRHVQELDGQGLIGRAMSASYVPKEGPDAERLIERLRELHLEHADARGVVAFEYDVWLWVSEV